MQCRYCEQNSAIRGGREPVLSCQCIPSSSASRANSPRNASRSNRSRRRVLRLPVQPPLHPHEEQPQLVVLVLVGVQNVGAVFVQQAGDAGHQTLAVRAVDEQNGCVFHAPSSLTSSRANPKIVPAPLPNSKRCNLKLHAPQPQNPQRHPAPSQRDS